MPEFPQLDALVYWTVEREAMRRRREAGETPLTDDPILSAYRFCNANVQHDRVSRVIFDTITQPYADHPSSIVGLTVCRFTNAPEVIDAVKDCIVPFDAGRFVAIMADRKARGLPLERRAYVIPGGVPGEPKAASLARDLFTPLSNAIELIRPKPGDTCKAVFDRLGAFPYLSGFLGAQIIRDLKQVDPLRSAPDWKTFVQSGPGSQRGANRVCGATTAAEIERERPEAEWRALFEEIVDLAAPRAAEHGIELDAQSWQNVLCETDKFLRFRSGDMHGARRYAPDGKAPAVRPRKAKPKPIEAPIEAPRPAAPHVVPELAAARDPNVPHLLFHDLETRSVADLKVVGAAKYAADPSTEIQCLAYAVDDEPTQLWTPGDPVPMEFIEAANNSNWLLVAHNDAFERLIAHHILEPRHGFPAIPLERRRCSMSMALAASLPAGLEKAAEALSLPFTKDKAGKGLMRRMAQPLPGGAWIEDASSREQLYAYCRRDVEAERALFKALPPLTTGEQALWELDARINARGFYTDGTLLEAARDVVTVAETALRAEFCALTGLDSTNQVEKFVAWLAAHGCEVADAQKGTLKAALRRKGLEPMVRRAIELRLQLAHASAVKVKALLTWRGDDNRVRGTLKFHGASTGRWAGHGPQPQNFKRDSDGIDTKIAAVMNGGAGLDSPVEAVGDIARAMIRAAPGQRLMIGDFSGIESCVLAWVSGQQSKLEQWAQFNQTKDANDDPYVVIGRSFGHPDDKARAFGKVGDLAFGYQGGVGAWQNFAPEDDASDEATIKSYRDKWRAEHPQTVQFWYAVDRAAMNAVRHPGAEHQVRSLRFRFTPPFLEIELPSRRTLRYPFPRIETNQFDRPCVMFKDNAGGKWTDCNFGKGAYGGIWTENIVSGLARDLLAAALQRLEAAGYPVVLHVHDEIVAEVPDRCRSVEEFQRIITTLPDWAKGLPVAAKVRESQRFSKPDAESSIAAVGDAVQDSEPGDAASNGDALDELLGAADGGALERRGSGGIGGAGTSGLTEARPEFATSVSPPPGALEPEPPEAPKEAGPQVKPNGGDKAHHANGNGRYPHGERDTGRQIAFYIYRHADGSNYLGVKRTSTKQFPQFHWTGSAWAPGAPTGLKIPYRLPELIKAPRDAWVAICAGEKDVETAERLGLVATTNPEGERPGAWAAELNTWFAGRKRVAIMEDNDATGRAHALEVATKLRNVVPDIRIVTFCDLPTHGDLTDWVERGHGRDDLLAKIEAAKPADGDFSTVPLTIDEWLSRDLPPLEPLVGSVLSTTTRALLAASTGIGKTNFGMALWGHAGLGRNFLHWHVPRPCRMLFIDGEMSRRLLRERIEAMARHLGAKPDGGLFFNKEDIEDFAPLNTSAGQAAVWKLIEEVERRLGGPLDAICFDNIVSLLIGDMKEEDAWRDTMPLVRALTRRRIGQLWLHHTGHDTSRGYGTKTREWQLDLVMHLTEVKRPDTDVSFTLSFPKARERTPDNRGDFTEVNIALVDSQWISETATSGKERPTPLARRFFEALQTAAGNSSLTHINGYPIATFVEWQAQCVASGLIDPTVKPDAARSMFSKYKLALIAANWIAANTEAAWILP